MLFCCTIWNRRSLAQSYREHSHFKWRRRVDLDFDFANRKLSKKRSKSLKAWTSNSDLAFFFLRRTCVYGLNVKHVFLLADCIDPTHQQSLSWRSGRRRLWETRDGWAFLLWHSSPRSQPKSAPVSLSRFYASARPSTYSSAMATSASRWKSSRTTTPSSGYSKSRRKAFSR